MPYFYNDANGQTQGPFDEQQLQELADQGIITPNTPLATDGGHTGLAGQIPGLRFNIAPSARMPRTVPVPASTAPPKQSFCTNCGNPVSAQAVACMSCGAKPVGHRRFCRQCGAGLNPEQVICVKCGAVLAVGGGGKVATPSHALSKTLNTYFMVFWICIAGGVPLSILFIGIPAVIAGWIFAYMLLYQLWKLIPADIARTTPGKAVGFCFIPFFNFYWIFVAFKGLGEDMNMALQQRGIQYHVSEGLGLTYCILILCCIIPYLNILIAVGAIVVLIFFLKSVKNGAIALLEQ